MIDGVIQRGVGRVLVVLPEDVELGALHLVDDVAVER